MQRFMFTLFMCSLTMSVLAFFYLAITPLLAKRYSAAGRYYTWLVIVLGLIIPFRPQYNNAIVHIDILPDTAAAVHAIGTRAPDPVSVQTVQPGILTDISWWHLAAAVWLSGVVFFLAWHVIKHYRFLKLSARWSEHVTDEHMITQLQNLKTQMSIKKKIGLQFCESIGSPMMIGFVNPRILIPKAEFAKNELCFILKHELVHYKRKDLWYKCLILAATTIHWFNPFVYLMAKILEVQCELSCDEEVVRCTDEDARQYYSETILKVVRHQSRLKTALSTNFYGGKKGMKERIISIMDSGKKKPGLAILFGILVLTLGTSFAFAAEEKTKNPSEIVKEDILVSYKFSPNPAVYEPYSVYGITISDDGKMLLYNGQRVRLFEDEYAEDEAFFFDEEGVLDLSVIRDTAGNITGLERISEAKAGEYRSAFFEENADTVNNAEDTPEVIPEETAKETAKEITGKNKFDQYAAFGISLSSDGEVLYYNSQRVKLFVDLLSDGSFETNWFDEAGTANLSVVRNAAGQITEIESISEEQAGKYLTVE